MATESESPDTRTNSSHRRLSTFTLGVFAVALIVRLLVVVAVWHEKPAIWFYSQASELGEVANLIVSGQGIASPFGGNTGPSAFLPPGYPLFVAALFHSFGSYSHSAELVLLLFQASFGAAAVLFLMLAARRLFGERTATITGVVLALHPWLIALSFVFWETSFSLMALVALVWIAVRHVLQPSKRIAYAAAVFGAVAISVNASLTLTCVALFAWAAHSKKENRKALLLPGILFVALCSVWPVRNLLVMHAFVPLRDNLGYELWQGNRVNADGFFAPELHPNVNREEFAKFQQLGELSYMKEKSRLAKTLISANPVGFVRLTGKRVLCFWLGVSRRTYPNQIAVAALTSLLGFMGLVKFWRRRGIKPALPIIIPLALFPVPYYITHPDFRFWCLLSPLLTALAVFAFVGKTEQAPCTDGRPSSA